MRLLRVLSAALVFQPNLAASIHHHGARIVGGTHLEDVVIWLRAVDGYVLESTLNDIADPSSAKYGKFLTREEAAALLQPHHSSVDALKRWLFEAGVLPQHVHGKGQTIEARVSKQLAKRLSSLSEEDEGTGERGEDDSTAALRRHVAFVRRASKPRATIPSTHHKRYSLGTSQERSQEKSTNATTNSTGRSSTSCSNGVTPACLRTLYHMGGDSSAQPHSRSSLGVVGFSKQTAQHDQLDKFLAAFAPDAVGANFSTVLVNGGHNPQGDYPGGEANLDIQYAVAMAHRVPVTYYSVGGEDHDFLPDLDIWDPKTQWIEPYTPFLSYLLGLDDEHLPRVISISYGINEQDVPKAHAEQICNMFGQLGTRDVSVIASSGDQGTGISCLSNDGTNTTKFLPDFPASCPYVTSVGGTQGQGPEMAWNLSSGGFSEYWPRPAWQDAAISRYLGGLGDKWAGLYNHRGRGFPDVSIQALGYQMFDHDKLDQADGTSASAPVFAAMVALLNDFRFRLGLPAMGFLNPWLYHIGSLGFTDITEGAAKGCVGTSYSGKPAPVVPGAEWAAAPGWDPATGLGTPLFDRLKALALGQM
ncbi:5-oxoprolinase [Purpureocillium lavendulum]|uniref:tripeptidyl-peptidase II n=1 Tax=Purpureocillium lavendulum TaxID=1247861 RepID=A0AB34FEQ6_9HYPO|nr:5-oxoprolinase [Purpureocillium lavendulum]